MTAADCLILGITGIIGYLIIAYLTRESLSRKVERAQLQAKVRSIREFQEQLGKLKAESIRETDKYKKLKEKYDERYRSYAGPAPDDGSNDGDGGKQ